MLQVASAGRFGPAAIGRRKSGLPVTAAAGSTPSATRRALAIDVAEHRFHQVGALCDAGGDLLPLGRAMISGRLSGHTVAVLAGHAVRDAGSRDMPVGGRIACEYRRRVSARKALRKSRAQSRAGRPCGPNNSSGTPGQRTYSRSPLRLRRGPRAGPCFPEYCPGRPVRRHSNSQERAKLMQERRPQVEGQREFNCAFLGWRSTLPGGVAVILGSGAEPARLGLVGINRLRLVGAPAGVRDVVGAAAARRAGVRCRSARK